MAMYRSEINFITLLFLICAIEALFFHGVKMATPASFHVVLWLTEESLSAPVTATIVGFEIVISSTKFNAF
jgi:hypothetical protein